jgi:hypothetical protein
MLGKVLGVMGLVALMVLSPLAGAVHGEAYDAYGTATINDASGNPQQVFIAKVSWTGWNYQPFNTFFVTVKDPSGAVVAQEAFPGGYNANGQVFYYSELLNYEAWAGSWSFKDTNHFHITGVQWQVVSGGGPDKALMYYTGNYYDYQLTLVVPYTVPIPF